MVSPADTLLTFGAANFAGGSTAGLLTAGAVITPIFTQNGSNSPASFAASGSHLLSIVQSQTGGLETITFGSAGAAASHPQNLAISGNQNVALHGNLYVGDSLIYNVGDGYLSSDPGSKATVVGPFVESSFNNFNVDTLELLRAGTPIVNPNSYSYWAPKYTRFAGSGQVLPDSIAFHAIEVTGSAQATGTQGSADSVFVNGGSFRVGPGNFGVNGDLRTLNGGTLTMTDAGTNLFVSGNASFGGGSTAGLLTAGTITMYGGSLQEGGGAADAFAPSGTTVSFQGSDFQQGITFAHPGSSFFHDLLSSNGLGVVLHGIVPVNGNASISGGIQGDTIVIQGVASFNNPVAPGAYAVNLKDVEVANGFTTNDTWVVPVTHFIGPTALPAITYNGNVVVNAPVTVPSGGALGIHNLYVMGPNSTSYSGSYPTASFTLAPGVLQTVDSSVQVQYGQFTLGGGRLIAGTDMNIEIGSTLTMTSPSDSIQLGRDLWMLGNSTAGLLTDGHLLIGRDLRQGGDPQSFAPSGNHVTEFVGPGQSAGTTHVIDFASPLGSHFANLTDNYPDTLWLQSTDTTIVTGTLSTQSAPFTLPLTIRGPGGGSYYPLAFGQANVHAAVFDSVPAVFHDAGSLVAFDSVSFRAPTDGFTQFSATGPAGDTVVITNPIFTVIGSGTGLYVAAVNTSGSGTFTVQAAQSNVSQAEFDAHVLGDTLLTIIQWLLPS
jgi:hypothetical protein